MQSRFVAHVWTGQIELPDESERLASVKRHGEGLLKEEDWHLFVNFMVILVVL